jgi:hypothetical protein
VSIKVGDVVIVTEERIEAELVGRVGTVVKLGNGIYNHIELYKYEIEFSDCTSWVEDAVIATALMKALS